MGLIGLLMACYGGLYGILSGLTKSTDHPRKNDGIFLAVFWLAVLNLAFGILWSLYVI